MATDTGIEKRESHDTQKAERIHAGRTYVPPVDIVEKEDRLLLLADLPGVKSDRLDISYERGELTLHGKVEPRQNVAQTHYLLREYGVGDFYRSFQVGEGIDASRIEAQLVDGVLVLNLPKTHDAVPRKIAVKTN